MGCAEHAARALLCSQVPDRQLIMENMLMAEGFVEAKNLAKKFASLYSLLEDLLSPQVKNHPLSLTPSCVFTRFGERVGCIGSSVP